MQKKTIYGYFYLHHEFKTFVLENKKNGSENNWKKITKKKIEKEIFIFLIIQRKHKERQRQEKTKKIDR